MGANLTERLAVVTQLTPAAARAAGSYVTAAFEGKLYDQVVAYLQTGTIAGAGTIQAKFQHCSVSASSAAAWADVNSACITSAFPSTSNDKVGQLELRIDQEPSLSQFLRVHVSAATSTIISNVLVIGEPKYAPAADVDSADVVQTVVY
jgi:hypothetical protein